MPLFFSNAVANWVNQHQLESYIIHQNKAHFTAEFQNKPFFKPIKLPIKSFQ